MGCSPPLRVRLQCRFVLVAGLLVLLEATANNIAVYGATNDLFEGGSGTNGSWNYATNWTNGLPTSSDNVVLDNTYITLPGTQSLDNTYSAASLEINSSSIHDLQANTSAVITSRTLDLVGSSSGTPLLSLGSAQTGLDFYFGGQASGHGQITLDLPGVPAGDSDDFDVYQAAGDRTRLFIGAQIVGSGSITKTNAGELDLGFSIEDSIPLNTFTGGVTLADGTLALDKSSNGSPGSPTNSPLGTGTLTIINGGTTVMAGSGDTVTIGNVLNVEGGYIVASNLTWTGPVHLIQYTHTLTVNSGDNVLIDGAIDGTVGITKQGPGTLTFGGANTYTGATTVSAGNLTVAAGTGTGIQPSMFGNISLSSGASMTLAAPSVHADRTVLVTPSLTLSGSTGAWTSELDVASNDAVVHNGNIAELTNQLEMGYNSGSWNATAGITSSVATKSQYTSIGVIPNTTTYESGGGPTPPQVFYSTFDGQSVTSSDVLIKYTYGGDANLDGVVNLEDYLLIDNGYAMHGTGWLNGDFNYDGVINDDDYAIIDSSYSNQGGSLDAIMAMPHWKIPGYANYFLPIYESEFGELSSADYPAAVAAGTPDGDPMPQSAIEEFAAESADLASERSTPASSAMLNAAVPEPFGSALLALGGVFCLGRRRHA